MNEKTAKLINKYSMAKGLRNKDLKREWMSMNAKERFHKRQDMIKDLMGSKA